MKTKQRWGTFSTPRLMKGMKQQRRMANGLGVLAPGLPLLSGPSRRHCSPSGAKRTDPHTHFGARPSAGQGPSGSCSSPQTQAAILLVSPGHGGQGACAWRTEAMESKKKKKSLFNQRASEGTCFEYVCVTIDRN